MVIKKHLNMDNVVFFGMDDAHDLMKQVNGKQEDCQRIARHCHF